MENWNICAIKERICAGRWRTRVNMSIAATLKRPYWRASGQMISSSLYLKHNRLVIQLSISSTPLYEMLSPSFESFSTRDFFLVFEWTIMPTFTGRGGSFVFECSTNPSERHLILTALNQSRCARFTTIELAFVERLSKLDFSSKINDTRFKSGRVTNDFRLFTMKNLKQRFPHYSGSFWQNKTINFQCILRTLHQPLPKFICYCNHHTSTISLFQKPRNLLKIFF